MQIVRNDLGSGLKKPLEVVNPFLEAPVGFEVGQVPNMVGGQHGILPHETKRILQVASAGQDLNPAGKRKQKRSRHVAPAATQHEWTP